MRFAAIADIHGNSAALDATLADIAFLGIEQVVNLGDSISGPLDPVGTADRLMAANIPTVCGNHDRALYDRPLDQQPLWEQWTHPLLRSEHFDWLRSFPATLEWNGVYLCHGSPRGDEDNWLHDRDGMGGMRERGLGEVAERAGDLPNRLILSGHTHMPRMVRLPDGRCLVNPGSVGCPAYADPRPPVPTVALTGAPDARYAIFDKVNDDWRVTLRTVPYDPTEMVARARAMGAEIWVPALTTGWVTL